MKIELCPIKIKDVVAGFLDSNEEGVVGYGGKLNIRPKYQREFIYDEKHSKNLKELFIKDMQESIKLSYNNWSKRPKYRKVIQSLARLLSPIL